MEYKYQGIILSKRGVGETDRIYTIYTLEMGKIRVLAKSVRLPKAKLAGFLEPITLSEIFLAKTKGLGKITGSIVNNNFSQIKSNLVSMQKVFRVFKILEKVVTDQERDEKIFNLLKDYLETMDSLSSIDNSKNENKKNIVTLGFLFNFLGESGYQIEVGKCVKCDQKLQSQNNYFNAYLGGFLCEGCVFQEDKKTSDLWYSTRPSKADDNSIKIIRLFLRNKLANFVKIDASERDVRQIEIIFSDFLSWIFGKTN